MSKLEKILSREMTRQQFLATLGVAIISLFGFSSVMGVLTGDSKTEGGDNPPGYGKQNYGP